MGIWSVTACQPVDKKAAAIAWFADGCATASGTGRLWPSFILLSVLYWQKYDN
jgi:hypothetical protein